jgi:hypothetical protein
MATPIIFHPVKSPVKMNANHHNAAVELSNDTEGDSEERILQVLDRYSMSADQLSTAINEVFSENDIEGAAIGVAAVNLAYPDHDTDDYFETKHRVLANRCPLLKVYFDAEYDFAPALEFQVVKMLDMIEDGAERLAAGLPLAV